MEATTPCMHCGKPVDATGYEQVVAFRKRRHAGGPNQVTAPKPTGEWACRWCIEQLLRGIAPGQESML